MKVKNLLAISGLIDLSHYAVVIPIHDQFRKYT